MGLIELRTEINAPIEICFDLSRSIDLHTLTTAKTMEKAIAGVTTGLMKGGEFVTWRAKHFGIWQELTTKMIEFNSPTYFHTVMVKGAFRKFDHEHIYKKKGDLTIMIDKAIVECPLGFLGKIASAIFIDQYMKGFLVERNAMIKEIAESGRWKEILKY